MRSRKYFALCPIATTSASRPAISPRASMSSCVRSPTTPRPSRTRPPGGSTPRMISTIAPRPTSLCARSITTEVAGRSARAGRVKKFIRPGLCSASGVKSRSPATTSARPMPTARAAEAAARAFSTLNRDSPHSVIGTSTSSTSGSGSAPGSITQIQSSITVVTRPPRSSASRTAGPSGSRVKTQTRARVVARIACTRGSSALSTAQPSLRVIRATTALTSASWSTVSMPCSPRWSAVTLVTTETSLWVRPMPLSRIPPRAVSVTARSTPSASTRPAPDGPE